MSDSGNVFELLCSSAIYKKVGLYMERRSDEQTIMLVLYGMGHVPLEVIRGVPLPYTVVGNDVRSCISEVLP